MIVTRGLGTNHLMITRGFGTSQILKILKEVVRRVSLISKELILTSKVDQ